MKQMMHKRGHPVLKTFTNSVDTGFFQVSLNPADTDLNVFFSNAGLPSEFPGGWFLTNKEDWQ